MHHVHGYATCESPQPTAPMFYCFHPERQLCGSYLFIYLFIYLYSGVVLRTLKFRQPPRPLGKTPTTGNEIRRNNATLFVVFIFSKPSLQLLPVHCHCGPSLGARRPSSRRASSPGPAAQVPLNGPRSSCPQRRALPSARDSTRPARRKQVLCYAIPHRSSVHVRDAVRSRTFTARTDRQSRTPLAGARTAHGSVPTAQNSVRRQSHLTVVSNDRVAHARPATPRYRSTIDRKPPTKAVVRVKIVRLALR